MVCMHICMLTYAWIHSCEGQRLMVMSFSIILPYISRQNYLLMNLEFTNLASLFNQFAPQGSLFSNSPLLGIYMGAGELNSGFPICMATSSQPLLNKMYKIELSNRKQSLKLPPGMSLLPDKLMFSVHK